jgi:hypothetical protein
MADPFVGQDKWVQGSLKTGQHTSKTEKYPQWGEGAVAIREGAT